MLSSGLSYVQVQLWSFMGQALLYHSILLGRVLFHSAVNEPQSLSKASLPKSDYVGLRKTLSALTASEVTL